MEAIEALRGEANAFRRCGRQRRRGCLGLQGRSPDGGLPAGTGRKGSSGDGGPATEAEFNGPHSLAIAPNGDLYIADTWNNCVRRIEAATGRISRFAGTGEKGFGGDGGPAEKAQFGGVYCVAFDPGCTTLYLADLDNRRIRAIDMESRVVRTAFQ